MKQILQKEELVLRKVAKEVPLSQIKSPKIQKILKEMSVSLKSQADGVAIAAPQIGYSLCIFVVSGTVLQRAVLERRSYPTTDVGENVGETSKDNNTSQRDSAVKNMVFINPKISKLSKEKEWTPEGCLSVRWLYGKTYRSKKASISAYDENSKKFTRGASGLLAQIFQHETDHLNGILFIDHAKDIKEELPK